MRGSRWLVLLLIVSCACISDPNPAQVGENGEVTLVLRGLVALETTESGLSVLFLSPQSDPHAATLSVDLKDLSGPTDLLPDLTIPDRWGAALAAWEIQEVTLDSSNVAEAAIEEGTTTVDGALPSDASEDTQSIHWIPHMADIYGSAQTMAEPTDLIAARGVFKAGKLVPFFDDIKYRSQLFTIGERKCTAVADGAKLKVTMKDSFQPVLTFKTARGSGKLLVRPGASVVLAAFPKNKPEGDLAHFHHYFALAPGAAAKMPTVCTNAGGAAPTGFPVRCAPIKFP